MTWMNRVQINMKKGVVYGSKLATITKCNNIIIIIRYLYSALQRTQRFTKQYKYITMTQSTKKYIHTKKEKNQHLGNRWVFSWRLKTETDGASLMLTGSRFQRRGPHTWNEMSPACFFFVRGTASLVTSEEERSRRLPSLLPVETLYISRQLVR